MIKPKYRYHNLIASSARLTAQANVINSRFEKIRFAPFLKNLIDIVQEEMLPILADEFSLTVYEGWSLAQSPDKQRQMIKESIDLHRHKGTIYSIKRILKILGFGEVQVLTGLTRLKHDRTGRHDGAYFYGATDKWAFYRIIFLDKPVANDQASIIKKVLESFAPAHMVLLSLNYEAAAITHNKVAKHDGKYNYGAISGG